MALTDAPIKAVVFDIGATLVTGPPVAPNKVIARILGGVTAAEVSSVIMTTELASAEHALEVLESRFGAIPLQAASEISELWHAQCCAPQALEGAEDVVRSLKIAGLKIGLLSDIWNPYYSGVEKALPNVVASSDAIVLSCRSGVRKPEKANFCRVLEELCVQPHEAVMVGDTYTHDIQPALEMGMRAIWVLARPDRESESIIDVLNKRCPAPTCTVSSIGEVLWAACEMSKTR